MVLLFDFFRKDQLFWLWHELNLPVGGSDLAAHTEHAQACRTAMNQTQTLIQQLDLMRHPEGGWYRELHRSPDQVQRQDGAERCALTAILFLLPAGAVSCWHRVIRGDEVWTHIDGAPLELFQCQTDGTGLRRDALHASSPVQVVLANTWQAARSLGNYSLMSCCVGPGFEFCDFEMARQHPATERPKLPHPELI